MQHRDTLIGSSPRAARRTHAIRLHGRSVDASDCEVRFDDGSHLTPNAIIWATGFTVDHTLVSRCRRQRPAVSR
jgi:hypothetical protein